MKTLTGAHRGERAVVVPYLAGVGGRKGQSPETSVEQPYHTITAKGDTVLVAPYAVPRYGEREGQDPRAISLEQPAPTIVPTQNGAQLVAAFMAQHNTDVVGHPVERPVSTIVGKGCTQGLVASTLVSLRGTNDGQLKGNSIEAPLPTISAGGWHAAEVRAFLIAYYGNEKDGGELKGPMRTVTSRDRMGLVTVKGEDYVVVDIGMRMLAPRELYRAQGFPDSYVIDMHFKGKPLPKDAQVRMVGNSVCPPLAAAIIRAQFAQAEEARIA
jgi:DNA (cytosine-5)-methyltransferase 1